MEGGDATRNPLTVMMRRTVHTAAAVAAVDALAQALLFCQPLLGDDGVIRLPDPAYAHRQQ